MKSSLPSSETSCPPPRRIKRNGSIEADSSTALRVMQLVSQVASLGTTVVCSVHQPRPEVVRLIDKVRRLVTLFMSCHVVSSHVLSRHVLSRHVLSCHVMSCHVTSSHVMSCLKGPKGRKDNTGHEDKEACNFFFSAIIL